MLNIMLSVGHPQLDAALCLQRNRKIIELNLPIVHRLEIKLLQSFD